MVEKHNPNDHESQPFINEEQLGNVAWDYLRLSSQIVSLRKDLLLEDKSAFWVPLKVLNPDQPEEELIYFNTEKRRLFKGNRPGAFLAPNATNLLLQMYSSRILKGSPEPINTWILGRNLYKDKIFQESNAARILMKKRIWEVIAKLREPLNQTHPGLETIIKRIYRKGYVFEPNDALFNTLPSEVAKKRIDEILEPKTKTPPTWEELQDKIPKLGDELNQLLSQHSLPSDYDSNFLTLFKNDSTSVRINIETKYVFIDGHYSGILPDYLFHPLLILYSASGAAVDKNAFMGLYNSLSPLRQHGNRVNNPDSLRPFIHFARQALKQIQPNLYNLIENEHRTGRFRFNIDATELTFKAEQTDIPNSNQVLKSKPDEAMVEPEPESLSASPLYPTNPFHVNLLNSLSILASQKPPKHASDGIKEIWQTLSLAKEEAAVKAGITLIQIVYAFISGLRSSDERKHIFRLYVEAVERGEIELSLKELDLIAYKLALDFDS